MARQKHVFPTDEIPHLWAHQTQGDARNPGGNLYFSGDTIYSYGSHFAIARLVENDKGTRAVFFNSASYSVTTAKHQRMVRDAVRNLPLFECSPWNSPKHNMGTFEHVADLNLKALGALKKTNTREVCKVWRALQSSERDAREFAEFFQLPYTSRIPQGAATYEALAQAWEGKAAERRASAARGAETRRANQRRAWELRQAQWEETRKAQAKPLPERLAAWRAGTANNQVLFRSDGLGALLRLASDGVTIETSLGARVPAAHVRKALPVVLGFIQHGRTYQRNGHTIHLGHYALDSIDANGTVKAGCHEIKRTEAYHVAKLLGLTIPVPEATEHY